MDHKIPADAMNSWVRFCVDEFVRDEKHKTILLKKWYDKATFDSLAKEFNYTTEWIKDIVYGEGDQILIKALELTKLNNYQKPPGY